MNKNTSFFSDKNVAEKLHVSVEVIKSTAERLFDPRKVFIDGNKLLFSAGQVESLEKELSSVAKNTEVVPSEAQGKWYTTKELAQMLDVSTACISNTVNESLGYLKTSGDVVQKISKSNNRPYNLYSEKAKNALIKYREEVQKRKQAMQKSDEQSKLYTVHECGENHIELECSDTLKNEVKTLKKFLHKERHPNLMGYGVCGNYLIATNGLILKYIEIEELSKAFSPRKCGTPVCIDFVKIDDDKEVLKIDYDPSRKCFVDALPVIEENKGKVAITFIFHNTTVLEQLKQCNEKKCKFDVKGTQVYIGDKQVGINDKQVDYYFYLDTRYIKIALSTGINTIATATEASYRGPLTFMHEGSTVLFVTNRFINENTSAIATRVAPSEQTNKDTMTITNVANALNVSYDTIRNCIKRIMPNKLHRGQEAKLTQAEVASISKELKNNTQVNSHLTVEESSTVKNSTTELEVMMNYKKATENLISMLQAKNNELKARAESAESTVKQIADGSGCFTMSQAVKALKLDSKYGQNYGRNKFYKDLRTQGLILESNTEPSQREVDAGHFKVVVKYVNDKKGNVPVTLVTGKGLVYLAKKFDTTIDESVEADA